MAELPMAAGLFCLDGGQGLRGYREVRCQPHQPALEKRVSGNKGKSILSYISYVNIKVYQYFLEQ
jgi:hypothetical protein